jgi:AcrR family transcriptional regulator
MASTRVARPLIAPEVLAAGERPRRADAIRNRNRILDAAEEVFAREGIAVAVDVVAERAGVGIGTLYRHFPTKEDLFEAIVLTRLDDLLEIEIGEEVEGDDPTRAFFAFLEKMAEHACQKHDLFDALAAAGIDFKSRCGDRVRELENRLDGLRQAAVDSGSVRSDVTTEQILGLVMGACQGAERTGWRPGGVNVMLDVVCSGLRASR